MICTYCEIRWWLGVSVMENGFVSKRENICGSSNNLVKVYSSVDLWWGFLWIYNWNCIKIKFIVYSSVYSEENEWFCTNDEMISG